MVISLSPIRLIELVHSTSSTPSHVICVSAAADHEVAALTASGVVDVTRADLIDFSPLVSRADPHNLPFFDGVFDLGFSTGFDGMLFSVRFVAEIERTVRREGAEVLVVGAGAKLKDIVNMFRRSSLLEVSNVTLVGSLIMLIMMRNNASSIMALLAVAALSPLPLLRPSSNCLRPLRPVATCCSPRRQN